MITLTAKRAVFQPEFVQAENSLCTRNTEGEVMRDGAAILLWSACAEM